MSRRRGRPTRVPGQKANVRLELLVTPAERADLACVARENGIPIATLLRDAINEYVADYRERPAFSSGSNSPATAS